MCWSRQYKLALPPSIEFLIGFFARHNTGLSLVRQMSFGKNKNHLKRVAIIGHCATMVYGVLACYFSHSLIPALNVTLIFTFCFVCLQATRPVKMKTFHVRLLCKYNSPHKPRSCVR